jgi:hypothetical protein
MTHRRKRLQRRSLAGALLGIMLLTGSGLANATTVRVAGTITETSPGSCDVVSTMGVVTTVLCVGIEETWAGGISGTGSFDELISLNLVSGQLHISGTETFDGCVGTRCGTLEWTYEASGMLDLETGTLSLHGTQHFTVGTGGLLDASGAVRFSLIGDEPATFEGSVAFPGGA